MPSKSAADKLVDHYWATVHCIARVLHRPSFERQYSRFWDHISSSIEPPTSFEALLLAIMLSAAISMSEEDTLNNFNIEKPEIVKNLQQGAEAALSKAHFLRSTKLETLQAFVAYLVSYVTSFVSGGYANLMKIPLCRSEVSRTHSALAGTAIRLAECMGLHRDGSYYGLDAVEIHVRRLVWYQLCFLDIRTCESAGPRPQIRREDFDTEFPLNVDDADLESPDPPTRDAERWTDMTFTRMR